MKSKVISISTVSLVFFLLITSCNHLTKKETEQQIILSYVDPLEKIFPERSFFVPGTAHADVARGEHASFQFAFRAPFQVEVTGIEIN